MTEPLALTVTSAAQLLEAGEISSLELTDLVLRRIDETEPMVHAYVHVAHEAAREAARHADRRRRSGDTAPLLGLPLAVKDNFQTLDAPTEVGSRVLKGHRPTKDAAVVERIRAAGGVIVGKTVTHEFAYGLNTPPTRNPWKLDSFPGASSAGSAVAVTVGSALGAVGTDTAGSIRTPAAVNGIVGLKPTYGRVSRFGVFQASPSLDHVGFLTRSVEDCTILYSAIAGFDARDPASLREPVGDPRADLDRGVSGLRLGVDRHYFFDFPGVEAGVRAAADAALDQLKAIGAELVDVTIPELDLMSAVGSTINLVDNSAWHGQLLRTRRGDYEPETRRMLAFGELIPAVAYANAQRARRVLSDAVRKAFETHRLDALIGPTVPVTAYPLDAQTNGAPTPRLSGLVHHNYPANVTGLPALSVPCGFADGLPVGLQIVGRPLDEATVLRIGRAFESSTAWHLRRPNIFEADH
ncbi:MAG: aspartyl/glutamyl-tRNA(Asn/Gln) amidotransferase subunit [Marmoricola sp.]|nr:aspartyl/glutamyl-tRNA(Asn/Gln) amidotransferase subunit [Marmoricola sp.]